MITTIQETLKTLMVLVPVNILHTFLDRLLDAPTNLELQYSERALNPSLARNNAITCRPTLTNQPKFCGFNN